MRLKADSIDNFSSVFKDLYNDYFEKFSALRDETDLALNDLTNEISFWLDENISEDAAVRFESDVNNYDEDEAHDRLYAVMRAIYKAKKY